ncbi:MAG: hypothetical protein AAF889_05485 [Cyanobacteria bacterium P01_D01_bin.73]
MPLQAFSVIKTEIDFILYVNISENAEVLPASPLSAEVQQPYQYPALEMLRLVLRCLHPLLVSTYTPVSLTRSVKGVIRRLTPIPCWHQSLDEITTIDPTTIDPTNYSSLVTVLNMLHNTYGKFARQESSSILQCFIENFLESSNSYLAIFPQTSFLQPRLFLTPYRQ